MHFAQTLDASVIPEWKSRYVNFTQGKKLIAKIDRSLPDVDSSDSESSGNDNPSANAGPSSRPEASEGINWGLPPPAMPIYTSQQSSQSSAVQPWARQFAAKVGRATQSPRNPARNSPHGHQGNDQLSVPAKKTKFDDRSPLLDTQSPGSRLYKTPPAPASGAVNTPQVPAVHTARAHKSSGSGGDDDDDSSKKGIPHVPENLANINNAISGVFFDWLNNEVTRANTFFVEMVGECREKLQMLEQQLKVFEHHRALHHAEREALKHPYAAKRATTFLESLDLPSLPQKLKTQGPNQDSSREDQFHSSGVLSPNDNLTAERMRKIRVSAHTSDFSNSGDRVGYYQAKSLLRLALSEFYHSLQQLSGFQQLNMTAIRKIVKKFDKQICDKYHWRHTETRYMHEINNLELCGGKHDLQSMISKVEQLYALHFTQGNHKRAVDSLRVATMGEQEHHPTSILISGLAYGAAIPLGVLAVYSALHNRNGHIRAHSTSSAIGSPRAELTNVSALAQVAVAAVPRHIPDETTFLLQVLGGFALIAVFLTGFTGCLWLWSAKRINYTFILELDRSTMMPPPRFGLLSSLYTFLVALVAYLTFTTTQSFHRYYPCLLLGISVTVLAFPYGPTWQSRSWLLHALWRLMLSGFYPVEFRDLLTGDIMCSLTYPLSNMELFFCIYCATPNWWTIDGSKHGQRCTSSHSRTLGFLNCLPGIWRFLQCWRRFGDTLDWFPHLLNAGKYSFNILYNMTLSLARISPQNSGLKALFIVMALINGVYSGLWDILMDFSLTPRFDRRLRSTLVFPEWWYWILMIEDLALRQNWVLYVIFWNHKEQGAYISFIVALLEITRRVIWVAFRVENEHSANIMRCRAFKDLHLPYDNVLKINNDEEEQTEGSSSSSRQSTTDTTRRQSTAMESQKTDGRRTGSESTDVYN